MSGLHLSTSINHKNRALSKLVGLYRWLETSGMSSEELGNKKREIMQGVERCPRWVLAWLEGWADCRQRTIEQQLVFFYTLPDGSLVSTHRDRDDYYEKRGIGPREVYELATHSGHYWVHQRRVKVECQDGGSFAEIEVKVPYFVSAMEKKETVPCRA